MEFIEYDPNIQPIKIGTKIDFISPLDIYNFIYTIYHNIDLLKKIDVSVNSKRINKNLFCIDMQVNRNKYLHVIRYRLDFRFNTDAGLNDVTLKMVHEKDIHIFFKFWDARTGCTWQICYLIKDGKLVAKSGNEILDGLNTIKMINGIISEYIDAYFDFQRRE